MMGKKENTHLALMIRNRAKIYTDNDVFRFKKDGIYRALSWNDFIIQSEAIAGFLLSKGVACGDNVGIFSNNKPQWTISDLGILTIRAVVVPVYATNTEKQLEYVINHANIKVLFVGDIQQLKIAKRVLKRSSSLNTIVTFLKEDKEEENIVSFDRIINKNIDAAIQEQVKVRLECAEEEDIASIIYTSGTSGEPKGVMLSHKNFLKAFEINTIRLPVSDKDISFCFLPLSHVFERCWTFMILYHGAINVYNENPKEIFNELPVVKPTVMCTVPRLFEKVFDGVKDKMNNASPAKKRVFDWALKTGYAYLEYKKKGIRVPFHIYLKRKVAKVAVYNKIRSLFGGNIRFIPCSGSAMSTGLREFFHALDIFVVYGYGATETTATVSCMRFDKFDFENTGHIMPDVEVKISNDDMILVKGETIFKGYYKKPEATAEVLKNGWYHTGDAGVKPSDDVLLMTDRIKDIIKTSTGKMVSPQKVELTLLQSKLIEQICVIGDNRQYLTALVVPEYQRLAKLAKHAGAHLKTDSDVSICKQSNAIVLEDIHELQKELPVYEKVVKIAILPEAFTIENNLLTNSLKVRRKEINKIYQQLIDSLYV